MTFLWEINNIIAYLKEKGRGNTHYFSSFSFSFFLFAQKDFMVGIFR
jgi:hypothetical protein